MEIIDVIHKRRSIRSFNNKPISDKDLQTILSAGMTAPSAKNNQPWHFIVITDEKVKEEITKISQYVPMVLESPISILVCGNTDASFEDYWIMDCSAAIQNMLLSSCALGIASVWTGINKELKDSYSKTFNLTKNIVPHSLVMFGYSDINFEKRDYFDKNKVHINKW